MAVAMTLERKISASAEAAVAGGVEVYRWEDAHGGWFWAFMAEVPGGGGMIAVDEKLAQMSGDVQRFIEVELRLALSGGIERPRWLR